MVVLNTATIFIIMDLQIKVILPIKDIEIIIKSTIPNLNKVLFKGKNGDLISLRFEQTADYCDIEPEIIKSYKENKYKGPLRTIGIMKDTKLQRYLPKTTFTQRDYIYDKIVEFNELEEFKND